MANSPRQKITPLPIPQILTQITHLRKSQRPSSRPPRRPASGARLRGTGPRLRPAVGTRVGTAAQSAAADAAAEDALLGQQRWNFMGWSYHRYKWGHKPLNKFWIPHLGALVGRGLRDYREKGDESMWINGVELDRSVDGKMISW